MRGCITVEASKDMWRRMAEPCARRSIEGEEAGLVSSSDDDAADIRSRP